MYSGSKRSETGCAYGPHETHYSTTLTAGISLTTEVVSNRGTQRAHGSAACRQAPEALEALLGVQKFGDRLRIRTPRDERHHTEVAAKTSLAAGTVPDRRTQRAYGSAACRASEALREALGVERPRDRLHRMTTRDARRHIPRNGHLFNAQDRPGRPRRAD